ncbi:hypothetical protein ACQ4PT_054754 [Festuca glaucescens]
MAATPWLLLLCLAAAAGGVLQALAQPDNKGMHVCSVLILGFMHAADFLQSIRRVVCCLHCRIHNHRLRPRGEDGPRGQRHQSRLRPGQRRVHRRRRHLPQHLGPYMSLSMHESWYNVRSFAGASARNCYTLRSLVPGLKYLVRTSFMYGNYDGLNRPPVFDLHLGVNYCYTVSISRPDEAKFVEVISVVPDDFVQVCLINTGAGTPFISGLNLRPLKNTMYPQATKAQGLVLLSRLNYGSAGGIVRYPDDPYDRLWFPSVNPVLWTERSTTRKVQNVDSDSFEAPSAVLQTAIRPRNGSQIQLSWKPQPQTNDPSPACFAIMHFTELEILSSNAVCEFYINLNGELWHRDAATPAYLYSGPSYNTVASRKSQYDITINATASSTLPPIINALEVYSAIPTTNLGTDFANGRDLSSRGLNGDISSSFSNLKAIEYLNLSNNNLVGSVPDSLAELTSLKILKFRDVTYELIIRVRDGSLNLRYENNRDLCTNGSSCQLVKRKKRVGHVHFYLRSCDSGDSNYSSNLLLYKTEKTRYAIHVRMQQLTDYFPITEMLLLFTYTGSMKNSLKPRNEITTSYTSENDIYGDRSMRLENRRFTYKELEIITKNFQQVLGQGGFGYVYNGILEDGTQVAVKLRSHSSNQGVKEFLAEAQILTRIHHKNLVSMIGYCKDGEYMALVYEYICQKETSENILKVCNRYNGECLPWKQRLRIALESAQGLEYLHKGCNPPLIHRDVKATNILLNSRMEARIADFGLSKAINSDSNHVSTDTVVGTPGYVDPEYHATMQLTVKSDVYSFGVVLLELVTGKPAIMREAVPIGIIKWARQRMSRGNIESVVDARMGGIYNVNSVWKVVEIALKCSAYASTQRPTMNNIVVQLQECIELEEDRFTEDGNDSFYTSGSTDNQNFSYDAYVADHCTGMSQNKTTYQMERNVKRVAAVPTGPAAR